MLPLKVSYSFTPCGKVVGTLGTLEKADGLTYVVFSRVRKFDDIAVDGGITWQRLHTLELILEKPFSYIRIWKNNY